MNFLYRMAHGVHEVSGRSTLAKITLFSGMAFVFLWVPDLDLAFIGILHHRSIVTHSILPALLLIVVGRRAGAAPIAGALIGLAVHLSCDLLSPMVGFAQIWLPVPIKAPLGPLSYLWLFVNALVAFILARIIAFKAFGWLVGSILILLIGGLTSIIYGWVNEGSLLAIVVTLVVFGISLIGTLKKLRLAPESRETVAKAEQSISNALHKATDALDGYSAELENFQKKLDISRPFNSQRWAVEALLEISESRVKLQKEHAEDPKLAEEHAKVVKDWGPSNDNLDYSYVLKHDLLADSTNCTEPQQVEHIRNLQAKHHDFLKEVKSKLAGDAELTKEFLDALRAHGGEVVLEQILRS